MVMARGRVLKCFAVVKLKFLSTNAVLSVFKNNPEGARPPVLPLAMSIYVNVLWFVAGSNETLGLGSYARRD